MIKINSFASKLIGGILVLLGTVNIPINLMILYMLFSGQLQPGVNYYMGDKAPDISEALLSVFYAILLIFVGWGFCKFFPKIIDRR